MSVIDGNMAGRKLFAVSTYPARTIELWDPPSWQQLFAFALANVELLLKPRHSLGTWFNEKGVHVLDIVVCTPDLTEALALGSLFDQYSIFDLAARREIEIVRPSQARSQNGTGGGNA